MRVIHVITGLNDGGAEGVLYRLCTHDSENCHVVVSMMDDGKYGPLLRAAGVEVQCLGMPRGRVGVRALWRLWQMFRAQPTDVVQTWMYHADLIGGAIARLAGIRALCWGIRHTTLERQCSQRSTIFVAWLCARLSRWMPRVIVSCAEESVRVHRQLGYDAEKFFVIPNGYDLAHFEPDLRARARLRTEWRISDDTPLLGMVARYDGQKDHRNLLAALTRLRDIGVKFECVLVGTDVDPMNAILRDAIHAAGLSTTIRLLGRRGDVPAVMNALDLHVLSSLGGEAFPNVLAEAMACGTPCITTDVGDAAMIVGDTGWVVPPSDSEALAGALMNALNEWQRSKIWQVRCRAARERVEQHFALDRMVDSFRSAWRSAKEGLPFDASGKGSL